ncbi:hypothetical protein F5Y18DRAFT_402792, partial [Xylariaceae sp. FL1019]
MGDVLKQIAGILVEGVLGSVQTVVDALLNALFSLSNSALALLDTLIHVPIVSDILNAIGIGDISFLDLFTWIAAVSFTIPYKLVRGQAPFPDNGETRALKEAETWTDLTRLCLGQARQAAVIKVLTENPESRESSAEVPLSAEMQKSLFEACHTSAGLIQIPATLLSALEALGPASGNPWSLCSAIVSGIALGLQTAGDFLVRIDKMTGPLMHHLTYL